MTSEAISKPRSRFLRSVRLDADLRDPGWLVDYSVTPLAQQILQRFARALAPDSTDRAWTITGPYGTGKSACALLLMWLASSPIDSSSELWSMVRAQAPAIVPDLQNALGSGLGLLPVVATLRRAPIATGLAEALRDAAERLPEGAERDSLLADLQRDSLTAEPDTRVLMASVHKLGDLAVATGRYRGLLLVLDELGQALEHAARHEADNLYLLQELGEAAQRSGERPLFVVGILHRSFESYAVQLERRTRDEWSKIQGRFADLGFLEPAEQMVRLAGQAVRALARDLGVGEARRPQVLKVVEHLSRSSLLPRQLSLTEFRDAALSAVPLHPLTLLALPYLFRRLAQNERSMFVYLTGPEPYALRDVIRPGTERLVRIPDLFDYCGANVGSMLAGQVVSRHWLEVADALDRAPDLDDDQVRVLKTVGLLGILGEFSQLKPTEEAVSLAIDDVPSSQSVSVALGELRRRSLLTYRRFDHTYRIWEGSDIDVDERLQEARQKVGQQLDLAATLAKVLPRRPVVARRHSYQSGAIRYFETQYLGGTRPPQDITALTEADGVLALCLPDSDAAARRLEGWAGDPSLSWPDNVVVVVPIHLMALREASAELLAINWVWEHTPGLRDDRVARRELAERTAASERTITQLVESLLDPRPEPSGSLAKWYYRGEQLPASTLSLARQQLSDVLDHLYDASPRIQNELINRRSLSSAAAGARRNLIDRMLADSGEGLLGMEGYPPERSMYESVLLDTGLHREEDGVWVFGAPPVEDPHRLGPVWSDLRRTIFNAQAEPVPVDRLFARIAAPPFGVTAGLQSVLLTAFLLAYPDETSLYREGAFVPEPGIADLEVLMRRPELFAIAGSRVAGERAAVVQRLAQGLKTKPALVPVVRALIRGVRSLPETSWRTSRLAEVTITVRQAFEQSRSPERLLFQAIPNALGEAPFSDEASPDAERVERFFGKLNAVLADWSRHAPDQLAWARRLLLEQCDVVAPDDAGWPELARRARLLAGKPVHSSLVPFIKRLDSPGEASANQESVLALVAAKPIRSWLDSDLSQFEAQARSVGQRFAEAYDALASLTQDEETAASQLAIRLRAELRAEVPTRVARAALTRLLANLQSATDEQTAPEEDKT